MSQTLDQYQLLLKNKENVPNLMEFPEYSFLSVLVFDFIAPVTSEMAVSSLISFSLCPNRTLTWRELVGDERYAMLC